MASNNYAIYSVSGNVTFNAGALNVGTNIYSGAGSIIGAVGRGGFTIPANVIINLYNSAQAGFTRLNFGGSTSSSPAIGVTNSDFQITRADGTSSCNMIVSGSVTSTQFKLSALNTAPISASDTGTTGEIRIVNGFIYVCVATNTWQRATMSTF
jgi:hypothetical protein